MMNLGNFNLGDTVSVLLQCVNGSRVATAPSSTPSFVVYSNDGTSMTSVNGNFGGSDHDSKTGLRRASFAASAGNSFASGKYTIRAAYVISGTDYAVLYSFTIV